MFKKPPTHQLPHLSFRPSIWVMSIRDGLHLYHQPPSSNPDVTLLQFILYFTSSRDPLIQLNSIGCYIHLWRDVMGGWCGSDSVVDGWCGCDSWCGSDSAVAALEEKQISSKRGVSTIGRLSAPARETSFHQQLFLVFYFDFLFWNSIKMSLWRKKYCQKNWTMDLFNVGTKYFHSFVLFLCGKSRYFSSNPFLQSISTFWIKLQTFW